MIYTSTCRIFIDYLHLTETLPMNSLTRTTSRVMAMRALVVPARNMATVIPLPPPKHKDKSLKKKKEEDVPKKDDNIEKIPKHTQPGSKYALKSEDFADEASYEQFANEPLKDKNAKSWPR